MGSGEGGWRREEGKPSTLYAANWENFCCYYSNQGGAYYIIRSYYSNTFFSQIFKVINKRYLSFLKCFSRSLTESNPFFFYC
jgi:hypothetical protein